jgi:hypothetical protein
MSNFRSQYIPEGVLIIVSILIAFAIDAWWDERQDRSEETRILEALRSEFQENADRLPTHIRIRESDAEHARVLVEQIQTVGLGGRVIVTPEQLMSFTVHGSFDPTRGAFDAMLQSGDLRFIESQTLRQRLVRWPMLVADAVENDHFLRSTAAPRAFDYLAERVDLGLVDQIVRCKYENSVEDCPSASFELKATSELSGIVAHIRGWSAESGAELEIVRKEALDLVQQLDEELAKR